MDKTHSCGELRIENVGQTVTLVGWVHDSTMLGSITFVDLRDSSGITQLVVKTKDATELVETANPFGGDWVQVTGEVVARNYNDTKMETGAIEVRVSEVKVIKVSSISIKRLIWIYENFGLWLAIKSVGYDIIAILGYALYCLTLPFQFIWLFFKFWLGKR